MIEVVSIILSFIGLFIILFFPILAAIREKRFLERKYDIIMLILHIVLNIVPLAFILFAILTHEVRFWQRATIWLFILYLNHMTYFSRYS